MDAAPFAGVFFCLVIFLLLTLLVPTPGVRIQLPAATDLPGTDSPALVVAVDPAGQFYFENQLISADELKARLQAAVKKSADPLTLVVQADKSVKYETLVGLTLLAREAGMKEALLATLPRTSSAAPGVQPRP